MLFQRFATTTALIASCLASPLTLGLGAAHAEDLDTVSATVTFGDLDLTLPTDDQVLAQRLESAAKSVCLEANPQPGAPAVMQACIATAVGDAMNAIEDHLDQDVDTKLDVIRTALATP